ncbi:hypothetical protein [Burkholderia territorii]|uniref:hypothetical protein n=1 Tax=Burkholderia territorii TaxID=1503055 RepID=UPI0012DA4185|nr:hypothetical protein [Burkholderia territorii]
MTTRIEWPREKAGAIIRRTMRFAVRRNRIAGMHFCGRGGRMRNRREQAVVERMLVLRDEQLAAVSLVETA